MAGTRASAERWAPPAGPRRTALRVLKFPNPDGCSGMELGPRSDLWLSWFGPVLDGAPLPLSICTGEKDPRPQHPSPSGLMGTTLTLGVPTEPLDHSPTARSPHGSCFPQGKATVSSAGSSPLSLPWGPSAPLAHTHLHLRACALCPRALPQTSAPPAHGLLRSGPPPPLVSQLPGGGVPVPPGPCQVLRAQHAPGTQEALHRSLLSAESAALGKRVNVADGLLPTQGQRPRKHLRSLSRVCVCGQCQALLWPPGPILGALMGHGRRPHCWGPDPGCRWPGGHDGQIKSKFTAQKPPGNRKSQQDDTEAGN